MNRRGFLSILAGAAATQLIVPLTSVPRSYFFAPPGGWLEERYRVAEAKHYKAHLDYDTGLITFYRQIRGVWQKVSPPLQLPPENMVALASIREFNKGVAIERHWVRDSNL